MHNSRYAKVTSRPAPSGNSIAERKGTTPDSSNSRYSNQGMLGGHPLPKGHSFVPMRPSHSVLQRKCACGELADPQLPLQRKAGSGQQPHGLPPIVQEALHSPGEPLHPAFRAEMDSKFGHDFSDTRVHTDQKAAESAEAVNALAYTVGKNVVFGEGQFSPSTVSGKKLLAHELAHVVQQDRADAALQRQEMYEVPEDDFDKQNPTGPSTDESSTDDEEAPDEESPEEDQEILQPKLREERLLQRKISQMNVTLEKEADAAAETVLAGRSADVSKGAVTSSSLSPYLQRYTPRICGRDSTQVKDFPSTYISDVNVDLTSPNHEVTLVWSGPNAAKGEKGPFHSSPGAGCCHLDCDDTAVSKTDESHCTPKGSYPISRQACALSQYPEATNASYFSRSGIALHYYHSVPNYPASHGCVRLGLAAARLIYDNCRQGVTMVNVGGTWKRGGACWKCNQPGKKKGKKKGK